MLLPLTVFIKNVFCCLHVYSFRCSTPYLFYFFIKTSQIYFTMKRYNKFDNPKSSPIFGNIKSLEEKTAGVNSLLSILVCFYNTNIFRVVFYKEKCIVGVEKWPSVLSGNFIVINKIKIKSRIITSTQLLNRRQFFFCEKHERSA